MFAAYKAHYPEEPFDVVDAERFFEVPLPYFCKSVGEWTIACDCGFCPAHTYIGEFDAIVRMRDSQRLMVFETKTEKRNGKANSPEAWAMRPQVGLYIWAAEQVYNEPFDGIILNVCTRQSPAGREPCTFRRDQLERSPEDKERCVRNIVWTADQIEATTKQFQEGEWPFDGEQCHKFGWGCDFYRLHRYGKTPETLTKFKEAGEYLAL